MAKEQQSNNEIKIEIIQGEDGSIKMQTFSDNPVTVVTIAGILEVAKVDLIQNTAIAHDEQTVEIEIDELDLKLNPDAKLPIGQKVILPKKDFEVREQLRAQAMKSGSDGQKVD